MHSKRRRARGRWTMFGIDDTEPPHKHTHKNSARSRGGGAGGREEKSVNQMNHIIYMEQHWPLAWHCHYWLCECGMWNDLNIFMSKRFIFRCGKQSWKMFAWDVKYYIVDGCYWDIRWWWGASVLFHCFFAARIVVYSVCSMLVFTFNPIKSARSHVPSDTLLGSENLHFQTEMIFCIFLFPFARVYTLLFTTGWLWRDDRQRD